MSCIRTTNKCPRKYCNSCPYNGLQSKSEADAEIRRHERESIKREQKEKALWAKVNNNF